MANNERNDNNLDFLSKYRNYAIVAFSVVLIFFIFKSTGPGATIHYEDKLGTVGDYFGGLLNPIFAFFSFMALLATIKIQSEALKVSSKELANSSNELTLTRQEIEKSTGIQKEQSDSLKIQNDSIKQQNFENTFFNMIDLHNKNIDNLSLIQLQKYEEINKKKIYGCYTIGDYSINKSLIDKYKKQETAKEKGTEQFEYRNGGFIKPVFPKKHIDIEQEVFDDKDYYGKKAISRLVEIFQQYFKEKEKVEKGFHTVIYNDFHNSYQDIIGHYFGTIYQILKFINESQLESKIDNPNRYAHLFRSQFSKPELELLFYHGLGEIGNSKLLPLLVKFEFFEHLSCSHQFSDEFISSYSEIDNGKVFGTNREWLELVHLNNN